MSRESRQDKWLYYAEVHIISAYRDFLAIRKQTDKHTPHGFATYCRNLVACHNSETEHRLRVDIDIQTAFNDVYGDIVATEKQLGRFEAQCYKTAVKEQRERFLDALQQTEPEVSIDEKHYKALFKTSYQQGFIGHNPSPQISQLHTTFGVSHSSDQAIIAHFLSSPKLEDITMITTALRGHGAKKRHLIQLHTHISTLFKRTSASITSIMHSLQANLAAHRQAEKKVTGRQLIHLLNTVMPAPRQKRRTNGKHSALAQLALTANAGNKKPRQIHVANATAAQPTLNSPAL